MSEFDPRSADPLMVIEDQERLQAVDAMKDALRRATERSRQLDRRDRRHRFAIAALLGFALLVVIGLRVAG